MGILYLAAAAFRDFYTTAGKSLFNGDGPATTTTLAAASAGLKAIMHAAIATTGIVSIVSDANAARSDLDSLRREIRQGRLRRSGK